MKSEPGSSSYRPECTAAFFNAKNPDHLPGLLGIESLSVGPEGVESRIVVRKALFARHPAAPAALRIACVPCASGLRERRVRV